MSTNCCVCMEICAHSGPHTYCDKHKASDYYGTATPRGCPSCAALRVRIEVLEQAIEWAIQYLERDVFNVDEVNALIEWMIDELRRRAKVSP